MELKIWPPREKKARGRAVDMTLIDGRRRPFLRAGMAVLREGNTRAV